MKVKQRIFYEFPVVLVSPLSTGTGYSTETDYDVLRDENGIAYLTGASLAGAFRAYLGGEQNTKDLFGTAIGDTGQMSRVFISDLVLDETVVSTRDGISLGENKTVEPTGKFDYQIVEAGAKGVLKIEVVIYDGDALTAEQADVDILAVIRAMHKGAVRFGHKKTRGMGEIQLAKQETETQYCYDKWVFDFETDRKAAAEQYLHFLENHAPQTKLLDVDAQTEETDMVLSVPLNLQGGISIRTYSAQPHEPDFAQLTTHNPKIDEPPIPVIPGSSWNGAIRARAIDILKNDLKASALKGELEKVWGKISNQEFKASQIIISESRIKDGTMMQMTRNCINRFSGGALDSALYTEKSCFGGETELSIRVKNGKNENAWVVGLLLLVLQDVQNGLLAVGGQTAIGRGVFAGNTNLSAEEFSEYYQALAKEVESYASNT